MKSGEAPLAFALAGAGFGAASASSAGRLLFHTASAPRRLALMKGLGALPLPAAMSSMSRPEAIEEAVSSRKSPSPALA